MKKQNLEGVVRVSEFILAPTDTNFDKTPQLTALLKKKPVTTQHSMKQSFNRNQRETNITKVTSVGLANN